MAAITAVLAQYPEDVVARVTHPVTGLPTKKSWLPTVKEVNDACEETAAPMVRQQERERVVAELMAEREAIEAQRGQVRPTLDEMKAKYGPDWGLDLDPGKADRPAFKAPSWDEIGAGYSADPALIARLTAKDEA